MTSSVLILALLVALADVPASGRPAADKPIRVTNLQVRVEGDLALISYDLEAPEGGTYLVAVELRRESDPTFSLIPSRPAGDVGEVKSAGPRKLIRWNFAREFAFGLSGEDYYFKIDISRAGGFPWLWVGLGSAAAAGAVVVITAGRSTATPASPGTQELPLPPAH